MTAYDLKRFLISFLFPNRCPVCDKVIEDNVYFCKDCVGKIEQSSRNIVLKNYCFAVAAAKYESEARNMVLSLKYGNNGYCAAAAGRMIYEILSDSGVFDSANFITCVPSSKSSLRERGYNHSELIAKEIAQISGLKYKRVLKKVRENSQQKRLSAEERQLNVIDAYKVIDNADILGKNIIVIDDVCTTGSTLDEIGRILLENGAGKLFAAVFAATQVFS